MNGSIRSAEPDNHGNQAAKTLWVFPLPWILGFCAEHGFLPTGTRQIPDLGRDVSLSHERYSSCRKSFSSQRWCCSQLVCTWVLLRWHSRFAPPVSLSDSSAARSKKRSKTTNSSVLVTVFAETLNPCFLGILQSGPWAAAKSLQFFPSSLLNAVRHGRAAALVLVPSDERLTGSRHESANEADYPVGFFSTPRGLSPAGAGFPQFL